MPAPKLRWPQFRSPIARAIAPVAAGVVFFAVFFLALWGVAALVSRNPNESSGILGSRTFRRVHSVAYAKLIAAEGPVLFPDLASTSGDLSIVLDHTGDTPEKGWRVYLAHPADRAVSCKVTQVRGTRTFTDCEGRTIPVEQLAPPPEGVRPLVMPDGFVELDLSPNDNPSGTTTTPPTSNGA